MAGHAAGASAYADFETIPAIGGSDGQGGFSHCAFWDSCCVGFMDPANTQTAWEPDGMHLSQPGYDATADLIATTLVKAGLYLRTRTGRLVDSRFVRDSFTWERGLTIIDGQLPAVPVRSSLSSRGSARRSRRRLAVHSDLLRRSSQT